MERNQDFVRIISKDDKEFYLDTKIANMCKSFADVIYIEKDRKLEIISIR
jgi:uncharacterized membrane protein YukC